MIVPPETPIRVLRFDCDKDSDEILTDECWFSFDISDPKHWILKDFVICDKHTKETLGRKLPISSTTCK